VLIVGDTDQQVKKAENAVKRIIFAGKSLISVLIYF
jgi:hypothetical protein